MTGGEFTIRLATGSARERRSEAQLRRVLAAYDVSKWVRTRRIIIEEGAIPFSHPTLRLNTRHLSSDDQLLSTFLHEQIHWVLADHPREVAKAIAQLKVTYETLPVGHPAGAADLDSSYLHLIVNYLELIALEETIGGARARAVFEFWLSDHYTELYRMVLDDRDTIASIVSLHGVLT